MHGGIRLLHLCSDLALTFLIKVPLWTTVGVILNGKVILIGQILIEVQPRSPTVLLESLILRPDFADQGCSDMGLALLL